MIIVHTYPTIAWQEDGYEVIFWAGEAFDYTIPFRTILLRISELLGSSVLTSLDIPTYVENEDFIEGSLIYGKSDVKVYFEYSLGYMSLSHGDKSVLNDILITLQPDIEVRDFG